jgi:cysteine desulfurase family protein
VKSSIIYLDHAAATPLDERVLTAMQPYFSEMFYNPSAPYAPAVEVKRAYNEAKHRLAVCLGGQASELVMTAGATESINLMINSVDGHIVSSTIEHDAVLKALGDNITLVAPSKKGNIVPRDIQAAIRPDTQLITIAIANHELGTIQPLRDIAEVVRAERRRRFEAGEPTPIYLYTDASQGAGQIDINVARLGVDALTLNAGKIYGPKQVGLLWCNRMIRLQPLVRGGGQERGLRSGTENVAGTIGFAVALELAQQHRNSENKRLRQLRDQLQNQLTEAFPWAIVSGDQKHRLASHLHISFPGIDAERLVFMLEQKGVLVATGSACAANSGTRSHVLEAIGLAPEAADGSLRLTLGRLSDAETCTAAAREIIAAINTEKARLA